MAWSIGNAIPLPTSNGNSSNQEGGDTTVFGNQSISLRRNFGLIFERLDANNKLRTAYNRFNLPVPGAMLRAGRSYTFMTKPDLNLSDELTDGYFDYLKQVGLFEDIKECLTHDSKDRNRNSSGNFIPLVTNSINGLSIPDLTLKTITSAESFRGWKIPMARNTVDSRNNPTISLNFRENNNLMCYHMHRSWIRYIELLDTGLIHRKEYNIKYNILDYAASIFHIVVAEDGEEILYICKFVGVFPTKDASSLFSTNENILETPLKFDVEYQSAFFIPMRMELIDEFNELAKARGDVEMPTYMHNNVNLYWTGTPYITSINDGERTKFLLKFTRGKDNTIGGRAGTKAYGKSRNFLNTARSFIGRFF